MFPTVLADNMKKLPLHREGLDHVIQLIDEAIKPCLPLYRLSPLEQGELKRTIDDLLAKGFIRPSHSPFGSPVIFVKKKDGSFRMCVDYRRLDANTVKSSYPIPRVDESLDRLAGARIFTQLDLTSGYHQVRIKAGDEPKTAFRTRHGTFEYTVVPFGLCNAPSTFANFMNSVLAPFLDTFVIVYLEGVIRVYLIQIDSQYSINDNDSSISRRYPDIQPYRRGTLRTRTASTTHAQEAWTDSKS